MKVAISRFCVLALLAVLIFPETGYAQSGAAEAPFRFNRMLSRGMRGKEIVRLQEILTRLGVYGGPVTGYFGPLTQAAVRLLQAQRGFETVGLVGPKTRGVLNARLQEEAVVSSVFPEPLPVPPPPPAPLSPAPEPTPPPPATPETSDWLNVRVTDFTGGSSYGGEPALTWYSNGYGMVWVGSDGISDAENVFFARTDFLGKRIFGPVRLTQHNPCACITAHAASIAWNGKFAAVWTESAVGEAGPALRFALLEDNGGKGVEATIAAPSSQPSAKRPSIKSRAEDFAITWENIQGTRMFAVLTLDDGVFTTNPKIATQAEWDSVNVPTFIGRALVENDRIYFERGTKKELVSTVSGVNAAPAITFGSAHAIVWQNKKDDITQLYFAAQP